MRSSPRAVVTGIAVAVLLVARPAGAIIKIPNSVYQLWGMSTQAAEAKVAAFDAATGEVQATVTEVSQPRAGNVALLKGTIRIQVDKSVALPARPAAGAPLVVFVGRKGGAALHISDAWFQAQTGAPGVFTVTQAYPEGAAAYPGSTTGLLRVLASVKKNQKQPPAYDSITSKEMEALHWPIRDKFEHANWGKTFDLGDLGVKATFMVAADVNNDRKADLLVAAADGVRFYLGAGPKSPFKEATATWGLAGVKAAKAAFGDVNGDDKPDLLCNELLVNSGSKFAPSKAGINLAGKDLLAAALVDVNGDRKADAVALLNDGTLLVWENPGSADVAWKARAPRKLFKDASDTPLDAHIGDFGEDGRLHVLVLHTSQIMRYAVADDAPPAETARLTSMNLDKIKATSFGKNYFPMKGFRASVVIDLMGGDGRPDLCVSKESYDLVLLNRGYGAFWFNGEARVGVTEQRRGPTPAALAAADMYGDGSQEMLMLDGKGRLYQVNSPTRKGNQVAEE